MANRSLGTLTVDVIAKTGAFEAGMDKAARSADKRFKEIEKRAGQFGKVLGASIAAGLGATIAGITAITKDAIDSADAIRDLSIRLGESTETLSAYGYAASQTGTDLDSLARGLKILSKNIADAGKPTSEQAKIFEALGVSVTDAEGNLLQLSQVVPQIADAFRGMEDGTLKAATAQALFGKSGLELIEFLDQGSEGLDELTSRFAELGGTIDQKTADQADQFKDTLGEIKIIVSSVGLAFARELLPYLIEAAEGLKQLAKDGDLAANAATLLGKAFEFGVGALKEYNNAVDRTSIAIETLVKANQGLMEINKNLGVFGLFADGSVADGVKKVNQAFVDGQKQLDNLTKRQNNIFAGVTSTAEVVGQSRTGSTNTRALQRALGGPSSGSKRAKTGKSEEEKEAERLQKAYESMNDRLKEQIALFGKDGEAAKLRYDLEFGELKNLTQAQKDELLVRAERLDRMEAEAKVAEDLKRIEDQRQQAVDDILSDLQFQTEMLGQDADTQERLNMLRYAGVDANSAYGQSILQAAENYQELRKQTEDQIELMDAARDSARGFFQDIYDGVKPVDALKDAFGRLADAIFDWATNAVIQQALGKNGTTSGGSAGGWLSALFGSTGSSQGSIMDLFSGEWGFANGGYASAYSVNRVNERGPELLETGGRSFLLMGSKGGQVIPNHQIGRGGTTNTNITVNVQPTSTRRTAQQAAVALDRTLTRDSYRNR